VHSRTCMEASCVGAGREDGTSGSRLSNVGSGVVMMGSGPDTLLARWLLAVQNNQIPKSSFG
jgi:hypothetical protein